MTINLHAETRYHQSSLWDGVTTKGNLRYKAIRHIENIQSELWAVCECFLETRKVTEARHALSIQLATLEAREAKLVKAMENGLRRSVIQMGDLRYMRPVCTTGELQERADNWRDGQLYPPGPES